MGREKCRRPPGTTQRPRRALERGGAERLRSGGEEPRPHHRRLRPEWIQVLFGDKGEQDVARSLIIRRLWRGGAAGDLSDGLQAVALTFN
jgi:hypothetical protein